MEIFNLHCVNVSVFGCSLALQMLVCQLIWFYRWARFNQNLNVANPALRRQTSAAAVRLNWASRRKYKTNNKRNKRNIKWCHPQEVTFTGQRRKRWPHQKGTRADSEKGVIWELYLDLLWRPWLSLYGPCTCMAGDKKDDASVFLGSQSSQWLDKVPPMSGSSVFHRAPYSVRAPLSDKLRCGAKCTDLR